MSIFSLKCIAEALELKQTCISRKGITELSITTINFILNQNLKIKNFYYCLHKDPYLKIFVKIFEISIFSFIDEGRGYRDQSGSKEHDADHTKLSRPEKGNET